jgi:hypothetical protein
MTSSQYNRINELLQEHSTVTTALEHAEASIKAIQLESAKALLPEHAALQVRLTDLEAELRKLSEQFYAELFPEDGKRTHSTPFGSLQYRKSTTLDFDDEEKCILRAKVAASKEADLAITQNRSPRFIIDQILRTREELNLEAIASLDDSSLAQFGITRIHKDNFKVIPFEMKSDKPKKAPKTPKH